MGLHPKLLRPVLLVILVPCVKNAKLYFLRTIRLCYSTPLTKAKEPKVAVLLLLVWLKTGVWKGLRHNFCVFKIVMLQKKVECLNTKATKSVVDVSQVREEN